MLHRWKSASLRSQLVAIMMALMLVALAVTGSGTLTLLHSYLQGQVDDKLKVAVNSVGSSSPSASCRNRTRTSPRTTP